MIYKNSDNSLASILQRDRNNYDLVRVLAAFLVIYGHANAMIPPEEHKVDLIIKIIGFDYSGALAVKVFFFLSGLVVVNSLLEKKNVLQFIVARIFRIWPALIVVLLCSSFLIGWFFTPLDSKDYFSIRGVYDYVFNNTIMRVVFEIPSVFQDGLELNNRAMNGSLWSLPYEVGSYIIVLSLFMLGVHRHRWLALSITVLLFLDVFLSERVLFSWRPVNPTVDDLAPFFALGGVLALFKDKVVIDLKLVAATFLIVFIFRDAFWARYAFYAAFFFLILYLFSRRFLVRLRLNFDISYGVYIWGWPVQQVIAHSFPNLSFWEHVWLAILIAGVLGTISWFLVEKPSISLGRRVYDGLQNKKINL